MSGDEQGLFSPEYDKGSETLPGERPDKAQKAGPGGYIEESEQDIRNAIARYGEGKPYRVTIRAVIKKHD